MVATGRSTSIETKYVQGGARPCGEAALRMGNDAAGDSLMCCGRGWRVPDGFTLFASTFHFLLRLLLGNDHK